ncbi:DUF1926 domain-containing protein [bacterium]|nr:DUF1926 domain-containing protein [bacterium]
MKTINFIFAVHLHQPVGNFEGVFEYATKQAYEPLIRLMHNNPEFPFTIHTSGPLWEYWDDHHPVIFELVGEMVERGQLELLGGGFYEPILAVIPRRDAIAQLKMMSDFLEDRFKKRPRGIWLTERIWEPHLPALLAEAGVEFTITDDYHLKSVGITGEDLLGHYITEESGKVVNIFPVSENLRYLIPFSKAQNSIEFLARSADDSGERLFVFGDDGEKFGLWPGTNKWVWDEGWMRRFIEGILANREVIRLKSFGEWLDEKPPLGKAYLPSISYFEMSEWTLPAKLSARFSRKVHELRDSGQLEDWRPFLKGGFWRGFLTKYPESSWMHKRMFRASRIVAESDNLDLEANKALYRAQCNCAYWHGVFGGLYLPHLRRGIFDNIINAERLAYSQDSSIKTEREDIDCDGHDEVFLGDKNLQIFIKPSDGGKIYEIDLLHCNRNIIDVLSRRREGYHELVHESNGKKTEASSSIHDIVRSKESNLEQLIHYDWFERRWLVDHILDPNATPIELRNCDFNELGDFANRPFDIVLGPETNEQKAKVVLRRNGNFCDAGQKLPLSIEKTIIFNSEENSIGVEYRLKNQSSREISLKFAVENHLSLMSRDNPSAYFLIPNTNAHRIRPGEIHEFKGIENYSLIEETDGFKINASLDSAELWMFPIETVSNSENGFERVYQETSLLHIWDIVISADNEHRLNLEWRIRK